MFLNVFLHRKNVGRPHCFPSVRMLCKFMADSILNFLFEIIFKVAVILKKNLSAGLGYFKVESYKSSTTHCFKTLFG